MGNVQSAEAKNQVTQEKDFYDVVLSIENITTVEPGWPLKFPNKRLQQELLPDGVDINAPLKWDCLMVAIHGQYNRGKTFILNLLTGCTLPSSKTVATVGLSFKFVPTTSRNRSVVILDTAGVHTPITVVPGQSLSQALAERKATEYFLRDVTLYMADVHLVVVTTFSDTDQEIIISMCAAIQSRIKQTQSQPQTQPQRGNYVREEVYVIHNFMESDPAQAEAQWKKYVVKSYDRVSNKHTTNGVPNLVHDECPDPNSRPIQVKHTYLCNHNLEEGKAHNNRAIGLLLSWIESGREVIQTSVNPLKMVREVCSKCIQHYVRGVNDLGYDRLSSAYKQFFVEVINSANDRSDDKDINQRLISRAADLGFEPGTVPHDFNCQFASICKQIKDMRPDQLRQKVVEWLQQNGEKILPNGGELRTYLNTGQEITWDSYCKSLLDRAWGDHITLIAISNVLKCQVLVITAMKTEHYTIVIDPDEKSEGCIYLCHWQDTHYGYLKPLKVSSQKRALTQQMQKMELKPANSEWVLRATTTSPISLKEYQLNPRTGIQFDFNDTFVPQCSETVDVKEDILYLELDVPGSEVEWSHDPKAKEKITIKGTRNPSDSTRKSIQSNRKMGEWKFIYNVPEGYNPEPVEEATLDDGVFTLKFKKGDLKPVVRKPVKPSKKQN